MFPPAKKAALFLLSVVAVTGAQTALHRFRGEPGVFGCRFDEPSHFTTGLMIHDYMAQGFPGSPVAFAKLYYLHYPKVAFGSWPPLFHIGLSFWMMLFPATRAGAMLFVSALTATLVVFSFFIARRSLPAIPSAGIALAVWLSLTTQMLNQNVQADTLYTLLSALCVYLFADYLEKPLGARAWWFGLALFGAVMTKNNALFLAIGLPLMVLLTRAFRVLQRRDFWAAIVPAAAAVVIWQYLTFPFVRNNMKGVTGESTPGLTLITYAGQWATLAWIGLLPFVLWGIYVDVRKPISERSPFSPQIAASLALLIAPALFHSILPHDVNQRYLLPSLLPQLIFAAHGLRDLLSARWFARIPDFGKAGLAAAILAVPVIALPPATAPWSGFDKVAEEVVSRHLAGGPQSILVVTSFGAEGALIDEIAVRDRRPDHWVLRGIKVLRERVGVLNRQTKLVGTPADQMLHYLQELPVSLVILANDGEVESQEQIAYMESMVHGYPELFTRIMAEPLGSECERYGGPCVVEVYRLGGANPSGHFAAEKLPSNMPLWQGL